MFGLNTLICIILSSSHIFVSTRPRTLKYVGWIERQGLVAAIIPVARWAKSGAYIKVGGGLGGGGGYRCSTIKPTLSTWSSSAVHWFYLKITSLSRGNLLSCTSRKLWMWDVKDSVVIQIYNSIQEYELGGCLIITSINYEQTGWYWWWLRTAPSVFMYYIIN